MRSTLGSSGILLRSDVLGHRSTSLIYKLLPTRLIHGGLEALVVDQLLQIWDLFKTKDHVCRVRRWVQLLMSKESPTIRPSKSLSEAGVRKLLRHHRHRRLY